MKYIIIRAKTESTKQAVLRLGEIKNKLKRDCGGARLCSLDVVGKRLIILGSTVKLGNWGELINGILKESKGEIELILSDGLPVYQNGLEKDYPRTVITEWTSTEDDLVNPLCNPNCIYPGSKFTNAMFGSLNDLDNLYFEYWGMSNLGCNIGFFPFSPDRKYIVLEVMEDQDEPGILEHKAARSVTSQIETYIFDSLHTFNHLRNLIKRCSGDMRKKAKEIDMGLKMNLDTIVEENIGMLLVDADKLEFGGDTRPGPGTIRVYCPDYLKDKFEDWHYTIKKHG